MLVKAIPSIECRKGYVGAVGKECTATVYRITYTTAGCDIGLAKKAISNVWSSIPFAGSAVVANGLNVVVAQISLDEVVTGGK